MPTKLPRRMDDLYHLLIGEGDVSVVALFEAMNPTKTRKDATRRVHGTLYAQVWIGTYVRRLNKKIAPDGLAVVPGQMKRTYRLTSTR